MRAGNGVMRGSETPWRRRNQLADLGRSLNLVGSRARDGNISWRSFLQQELCRLYHRLGMEARAHAPFLESIGDGDHGHSLMVSHVGANDRHVLTFGQPRRSVVQGLVPTVPAAATSGCQT